MGVEQLDFSRATDPRDYLVEISNGSGVKRALISSTRYTIAWLWGERFARQEGPEWYVLAVMERPADADKYWIIPSSLEEE